MEYGPAHGSEKKVFRRDGGSSKIVPITSVKNYGPINPLLTKEVLRALIDFTLLDDFTRHWATPWQGKGYLS